MLSNEFVANTSIDPDEPNLAHFFQRYQEVHKFAEIKFDGNRVNILKRGNKVWVANRHTRVWTNEDFTTQNPTMLSTLLTLPDCNLDAELYRQTANGKMADVYICNSLGIKDSQDYPLAFAVFDNKDIGNDRYSKRREWLIQHMQNISGLGGQIHVVDSFPVETIEDVKRVFNNAVRAGYEGVVLNGSWLKDYL